MKLKTPDDALAAYDQILNAADMAEAQALLNDAARGLGFSAYSYYVTDGRLEESQPINRTNVKSAFTDDYVAGTFWERDPVVLMATQTLRPFCWQDAYRAAGAVLPEGRDWREVDDLAKGYGYVDGVVLPMRSLRTSFSISLFSDTRLEHPPDREALFAMQLLGLAFDSLIDETNKARQPPPLATDASLTRREIDVLLWFAEGKTSEEIGIILGISGKTVDFHAAKIISKLGVVNRVQAVAHAIRFGII